MRALLCTFIACTWALSLGFASACSAAERPPIEREVVVPLGELSGLALWSTPKGNAIIAIGDEARELVVMPFAPGGLPDGARVRRIPLPLPDRPGGSELEAVAVDVAGRVWVLAEHGEVFMFFISEMGATLAAQREIVVPAGHPLKDAWDASPNARAEGLAIVGERAGSERVFITKQANPAAIVELRDDGGRFVAAATFLLTDMSDASDMVVRTTASGRGLYVIGAESKKICRVPIPASRAAGAEGGPLACERTWLLPDELGWGETRWEGLAFLPDGRVVVGVDRKKFDRPNVAVLPALAP